MSTSPCVRVCGPTSCSGIHICISGCPSAYNPCAVLNSSVFPLTARVRYYGYHARAKYSTQHRQLRDRHQCLRSVRCVSFLYCPVAFTRNVLRKYFSPRCRPRFTWYGRKATIFFLRCRANACYRALSGCRFDIQRQFELCCGELCLY